MKKLNIVYAYMRDPRFEIELPERGAVVVWTMIEEPDADIIVYFSGYSYDPKQVVNTDAFRILYTYEPLVVYPRQFLKHFWKPFDAILTWSEALVEQGGKFIHLPSLYYDFPFGAAHGVVGDTRLSDDWKTKKNAMVQVAGNKHSFVRSELYSRRREIARWFGKHGALQLDTYGVPAMPVPNYRGHAADKLATLSKYRFALCLENESHPLWSRGYVTEKIFDCFHAFTVPVYLGASDIAEHIPVGCYIDLRDFESLDELDRFLALMSDETYVQYLEAIECFLKEYDAPREHSCFKMYETALDLAAFGSRPAAVSFGFWQKAVLSEKAACALMMVALPIYKSLKGTRYAGT